MKCPTNSPGIRSELAGIWWLGFFQIASSLSLPPHQVNLEIWLLLTFAYELGLTNRSHHYDQDDEIFNLKLVREKFKHFDFSDFISPLCPVCVSRATWITESWDHFITLISLSTVDSLKFESVVGALLFEEARRKSSIETNAPEAMVARGRSKERGEKARGSSR